MARRAGGLQLGDGRLHRVPVALRGSGFHRLAGETRVLTVTQGPVPPMGSATTPQAVVLNVTVTNPSSASYLTVFPDGAPPLSSDLNFTARQTVPNMVVVKVASDGTIKLFNAYGTVDVIVDLVGWYG